MLIYANFADYLLNRFLSNSLSHDGELSLRGSDRPFLVLENGEELVKQYDFLIEYYLRGDKTGNEKIYEIGFPWVQVTDWKSQQTISQNLTIETKTGQIFRINLRDEVLDETQVIDENEAEKLLHEIGDQCDRTTAETIALFISLFDTMLGDNKQVQESSCSLIKIPALLGQLSGADARLPLVLALNRRYELRHKLEMIAPKLRSQLNRTAEMMKLGRIQEMDAYCLRDYVRRPGSNAIEKAGARQELMGIQRYQNFNTPENRFLKGFCDLLHLDSRDYRDRYDEAKSLERAIDRFRQEPSVQAIPRTTTFAVKPNYVLQQNPIYRSFYQAYLDYLKRRTEKERIWSYRQALLVDVVTILLVGALLNLEGSYVLPTASVRVLSVPNCGRYLLSDSPLMIQCLSQRGVFRFSISQPNNPKDGDLFVEVVMQSFSDGKEKRYKLPIWIFWYKPSDRILRSMKEVTNRLSIYLYLYDNPNAQQNIAENQSQDPILKLPNPIGENNENLEAAMKFLTDKFCAWFGRLLT